MWLEEERKCSATVVSVDLLLGLSTLIRMILTMNNTSFNNKRDIQIHGTAMGTKMGPSFANLFLGHFESYALKNAQFQPHTWLRYIDDISMIWTHGLDNLKFSLIILTFTPPFISPFHTPSLTSLFLTLLGISHTKPTNKSTDKHQY